MKNHSKHLKLLSLAFLVAAFTVIMITSVSAEVVASGSFADKATYNKDTCTWTYSLDSDGVLTIGGTGADGNTNFSYNSGYSDLSANSFSQLPWHISGGDNRGIINGTKIIKVIIEESTGITRLGTYSLGYLQYMEELVIPSTVTEIWTSCFSTAKCLKTIRVQGADDLGEGCWDFRNIETIKSHTFAGASSKSNVPDGIDIYFSEKLASLPSATSSWNWFTSFGSNSTPNSEMTASVTFHIYAGSYADTILKDYVARQQTYDPSAETPDVSQIDKTCTTNVEIKYIYPYSGTFANEYYTNATWEWALDKDGTLYISGSAADGSTKFYYGGYWDDVATGSDVSKTKKYIPWHSTKQTDSTASIAALVKKVVIDEATGITVLGTYSLGYLPNMTELVIPSTAIEIDPSFLAGASSLKTISVHGKADAGEGIYDFRNMKTIDPYALEGAAKASKVTEPINVWLGENTTGLPAATDTWRWFYPYGVKNETTTPDSEMTTKVIFKVYAGTEADSIVSAYVARQQTYDPAAETPDISQIDKGCTTNVEIAYYGIGGNCKDDYSGYLWEFDEESGVLTISGTSTSTILGFTNVISWEDAKQKNIPWYDYRSQIKKVVIEEDTGITAIQAYVFSNLENCTTVIMPTTVSDLSAYNIFASCTVLSSIAYSEDEVRENVYDLRYAKKINSQLFEEAAKGMTLKLICSSGSLPNGIVKWFTASTTVNFDVFADSPIDKWLKNVAAGTDTRDSGYLFTIGEITYMSIGDNPLLTFSGTDTVKGNYSWSLDYDTGTLTFTRLKTDWCELYFNKSTTDFTDWLNDWRDDIKHLVIPKFSKYQDADKTYPFSNLPNLETVKWDTTRMMNTGANSNGVGMFYGCPKLTTFGTSTTFEKGVINLSGFSLESISTANYSRNMFYGCKSITKVILDGAVYKTGDTDATIVPTVIGTSMFEGCTSLSEIDLSDVGGLMSNAFKGCSALKGEIYYAGDSEIGTAFDDCGGIVIRTDTAKRAIAIASSMSAAGVTANEAMVASMIHGGFSVRVAGYNGLRSFYTFIGDDAMETAGYTLVEYGSLCGAADNYSKYTQDFGNSSSILTLEGTEFKTPDKIVKTALYIADGYTGKLASKKTVNDDGSVTFTVTITNFVAENYKSGVIMTGYEIWKDADGNYTVIYTEVENEDYKKASLYKVTLGMLLNDVIDVGAVNAPVYDVLISNKKEAINVGNAAVEGFIVDHHLIDGKTIAIYRTDSETEITLDSTGISIDQLASITSFVFGKNISCSIPEIDDYWQEHINAQLATLPKGRSFIAITDTHYPSNAGKSADLMQYVRKMTGIEKVVNLGDPYHDGADYDTAKNNLIYSMETKFFDYFGEDGMYAIGNHDSNITKARTVEDSNSNTYKMDLLLSDKDIYENSFYNIEEGGKKNGNVVYDEALLDLIEANKEDVKAFVLDNVAAEDALSYNNLFGNVSYTAEEMYENLVYWAKMHYAYYDHESKICYLVLNTGGLTVTDFATLNRELWKFHPSQYNFIETILNQVSEKYSDYDVVVAGHMFYDRSVAGETYNQSLFKMLSAFKSGSSVSFTAEGKNPFSGKLFGCTDDATSRTMSYDFTGREFTGEIFCITGHRHLDLDLVSQTKDGTYQTSVAYDSVADDLSDDSILLLLLNQDNYSESKGTEEADSQTMVKGTITEQCFTIFTLTDDNTLVATRIGANDGWLQKTYKMN